jgi:S-DNA-T family DNA segregation ATPase FtsK/SpoIIIE
VLVDGLATLRDELESDARYDLLDDLDRVLAGGPAAGIVMAVTAERAGAVPAALAAVTSQRWVLQPADPGELGLLGVRPADVPAWCPGRAHLCEHGLEAQLAWPGPLDEAVVTVASRWAPPRTPPPAVGVLPATVSLASLCAASPRSNGVGADHGDADNVVVGIGDRALTPIGLTLRPGDHALVVGPPRSGRSNALAIIADQLRAARPEAWIGLVAPRDRRPSHDVYDRTATDLTALDVPSGERAYLLVDDAELVEDLGGLLATRLHALDPHLHVIAAGRPDALRAGFGHWTQLVRRSRLGVLLQPDPLVDGDLLGVTLPRHRRPINQAGRGYVVAAGLCDLAQLALARSAAVSVGPARTSSSAPPTERAPASVYASA